MPPFRAADGRLIAPVPAPPPRPSSAEVARAAFRTRLLGSLSSSDVLQWRSWKKFDCNTETASPSGRRSPEQSKRRVDSSSSEDDDGEDEDDDEEHGGRDIRTKIAGVRYQVAVGSSIQVTPAPAPVKKDRKDESPPAATPSDDESEDARAGPSRPPPSSRPWNLRKRRSVCGLPPTQRQRPQSPPQAAAKNHLAAPRARKDCLTEKKEKTRLQLTLTKDEIYEDFILMTGVPPPRRPKKRPVKIQRSTEALYPEPSSTRITADLYKVPEEKRQRR